MTLAKGSGYSRYAIARWLQARAEPKLPEFLRLVEVSSRRALDFIATLTDPATLDSAREHWERLESLRQAAYEETWSHAVLRALELAEYEERGGASAWLREVLGITEEQSARVSGAGDHEAAQVN